MSPFKAPWCRAWCRDLFVRVFVLFCFLNSDAASLKFHGVNALCKKCSEGSL